MSARYVTHRLEKSYQIVSDRTTTASWLPLTASVMQYLCKRALPCVMFALRACRYSAGYFGDAWYVQITAVAHTAYRLSLFRI